MKSVTIREAQHNLGKILLEVEAGATIQITRRSTPLARLIPEPSATGDHPRVDWSGHATRLIKRRASVAAVSTDAVLDDLRGER